MRYIVIILLCTLAFPKIRADEFTDNLKRALQEEIIKALKEGADEESESTGVEGAKNSKKKKGAEVVSPEPVAGAPFSFESQSITPGSIFPSVILATATAKMDNSDDDPSDATHYGDPIGSVGVLLKNVRKDDKFVIEIIADSIFKPSKLTFTAKASELQVTAWPKLKYDYEALNRITQTRPINITFKVTKNGQPQDDLDEVFSLRQINDCPYVVNAPTPKKNGKIPIEYQDIRFMFAAYVNENHPFVDQILKEAKATGLCREFIGYQSDDRAVLMQVNAIWVALQKRGITYSSITDTTPIKGVQNQHVRFLDESMAMTQANCVDGSVLMASVLKKIGIKASLVLVPGHCYLAFYSNAPEKGGKLYGLETTMLGHGTALESAINYATVESPKCLQKNFSKFDQPNSGFMLVDLDNAREMGIMPIAYIKGLK
jgi:hypothetical protein